jgi:hypothetical protein
VTNSSADSIGFGPYKDLEERLTEWKACALILPSRFQGTVDPVSSPTLVINMTDPLHTIAGMTPAEQLASDFRRLGVASGEVRINHLRSAIHRGSIQIARSWNRLQDLAEFAPMESDLATLLSSAYRVLDPRNRPNYQERIFLACLSERPHPTERRIRSGLTDARPSLWSAMSKMASRQEELQQAGVGLSSGEAASWRLVGIDPDPEADELSQVNAASLYGMLADRPEHARDGKTDQRIGAGNSVEKVTKRGVIRSPLSNPIALIGTADRGATTESDSKKSRPSTSTLDERREVVQSLRQLSKGKPVRKPSAATKATQPGITPAAAKPSVSAKKRSVPLPSAAAISNASRNRNLASPTAPTPVADATAKGVQRPPISESTQPQARGRHLASKSKTLAITPKQAISKAPTKAKKKSLPVAAIQGNPSQPANTPNGQKVTWTQLLLQWLRWPLARSRSSRDSNVSKWIDGLADLHRDSSKSV